MVSAVVSVMVSGGLASGPSGGLSNGLRWSQPLSDGLMWSQQRWSQRGGLRIDSIDSDSDSDSDRMCPGWPLNSDCARIPPQAPPVRILDMARPVRR